MLRVWVRAVAKPSVELFSAEREKVSATLAVALAWIVFLKVVVVLVSFGQDHLVDMWLIPAHEMNWDEPKPWFYSMIAEPAAMFMFRTTELTFAMAKLYGKLWRIPSPIIDFARDYFLRIFFFVTARLWLFKSSGVLLSPVYFLLTMGVRHFTARLLGGKGQFGRYAYLFTLFIIPLSILRLFLDQLPLLGPVVEAGYKAASLDVSSQMGEYLYYTIDYSFVYIAFQLLSLYSIALAYMATEAEHEITSWRAAVVVVVGFVMSYLIRNSLLFLFLGRV